MVVKCLSQAPVSEKMVVDGIYDNKSKDMCQMLIGKIGDLCEMEVKVVMLGKMFQRLVMLFRNDRIFVKEFHFVWTTVQHDRVR